MKKYLFFLILLVSISSFAQVGIGTSTPAASAKLEVNSSNKGFLPPRVALTSTSDVVTIASPVTGLLVYCTGLGGLTAGYYYWNGNLWVRIDGVPYIGATSAVNLGGHDLTVNGLTVGLGSGSQTSNTANGFKALFNNTTGSYNTAIGYAALYNNTTGIGNEASGNNALYTNTTGNSNTANGSGALYLNTTGSGNTATGNSSLYSNTIGIYNTANGTGALAVNNTGSWNTATGYNALYSSTIANSNTANGFDALFANTTGNSNTADGYGALQSNTTGSNNTANGNIALYSNTSGNNNTVFGAGALQSNITGSNLTALGVGTDVTRDGINNSTAIGYGAIVSTDNTVRIGNVSVTNIGGQVSWTAASDVRLKKNINNTKYGLSTVMQLRPVDYNLISNDLRQVGFIAQEVQKLVPEVVTGKEGDLMKGETLGITYANLVPVLTKAIQEQQKEIEQLKALVNQLVNKKN